MGCLCHSANLSSLTTTYVLPTQGSEPLAPTPTPASTQGPQKLPLLQEEDVAQGLFPQVSRTSVGGHSQSQASGNQDGQSPNSWATAGSLHAQAPRVRLRVSPPGCCRKAPRWAPRPRLIPTPSLLSLLISCLLCCSSSAWLTRVLCSRIMEGEGRMCMSVDGQ